MEARELLSVFTVTSTADSGPGSLRQAILDADFHAGPDTINFNIAPGGSQTIEPLTELPQLNDAGTTIDATTQPGFAGRPVIELRGDKANLGANGFLIGAGTATIRGFAIDQFSGSGIRMEVKGGNVIQGNFLGLDLSGAAAPGNGVDGVLILNGSSNNLIGGTAPAQDNVISGNKAVGVRIAGASTTANLVQGNFIGTDATASTALGNAFDGVLIDGSPGNVVGDGAANIISGNGGVGLRITGATATGNVVAGNGIGVPLIGVSPLPNASNGVYLTGGASGNVIGGIVPGTGNTIAFNGGAGVAVVQASGNAILSNSIFSNAFLPIDINSDGLTTTNLPVMTSAFRLGTGSLIQGAIVSTPNTFLVVQLFASAQPGPSGYGGSINSTLLGTLAVQTNAAGNGSFRFTLPSTLTPGQWITATATDQNHQTWEFAQGVPYLVHTAGDFDGDGKADLAVFRPPTALWQFLGSQVGLRSTQFGIPGQTTPVAADYDNDGKTDLAAYQPAFANWFVFGSKIGPFGFQFGTNGDIPVPGDYDGDGRNDNAVFRPSTGQWFVIGSRSGGFVLNFGAPGDLPVPGDYDAAGKTEFALYRPSTGQWIILGTSGPRIVSFGVPNSDLPVPADYDGDGKVDLALYRPSTGTWTILGTASGTRTVSFGAPNSDLAVPADYDGDGKVDLAVYRPSTGQWLILQSSSGPRVATLGTPNADLPVLLPTAYRILGKLLPFTTSSSGGSSLSASSIRTASLAQNDPLVIISAPDTVPSLTRRTTRRGS